MTEEQQDGLSQAALLNIASDIVASYVSNNSVRSGDLAEIINSVHAALTGLAGGETAPAAEEPQAPAISVKKSVTSEFIICLEDGKKFKSMRRHLMTAYNMTPEQYRAKWDLPRDYPMVAPEYAASRSALAKSAGLGQYRAAAKAAPVPGATRGRGRPKKAA
ncbi:MucR family transcriptional regulator [Beijerinckia sp. L45]|uniref:MucR family transcriptional regulator n=1 Tax=Beijerinckia sp. L45 TaxID=1641855 RepID=UPI00131D1A1D|nr:MucR family transcriptional regulator [Beijerinckia sp. L45]